MPHRGLEAAVAGALHGNMVARQIVSYMLVTSAYTCAANRNGSCAKALQAVQCVRVGWDPSITGEW